MYYYKNYKRVLIRMLTGCLLALVASPAVAQKYYTAQEGKITAYYLYKGQLSKASGHKMEVIFNKDTKTLWVIIPITVLSTGNKKIDRKLFRKSKDEFVIKAEITPKNIHYYHEDYFLFSIIGRIFNKDEVDPVGLSGWIEFKSTGSDEGFTMYMDFGAESKWMGAKFLKHSNNTVVNFRITAEVEVLNRNQQALNQSD